MSGGFAVTGSSNRIRIKGHAWSVTRFFFISVAFMAVWILTTSMLGYYSKIYGPSILLQLNIAFYLPSIPVLVVFAQLEKVLDAKLGPTRSMMVRLNSGLVGCLVICAAFPFFPHTRWTLLSVIAVLGVVSSIAFSTAYQLVAWFRAADTISLGLGCVGSGPLVLLLQLLLEVGPSPHRWQWIAMYEIAAGFVLAGLLSSLSLFGQYWPILTGQEQYHDGKEPLLPDMTPDITTHSAKSAISPILSMPDPFQGMPLPLSPGPDPSWDNSPPVLHRSASDLPKLGATMESRFQQTRSMSMRVGRWFSKAEQQHSPRPLPTRGLHLPPISSPPHLPAPSWGTWGTPDSVTDTFGASPSRQVVAQPASDPTTPIKTAAQHAPDTHSIQIDIQADAHSDRSTHHLATATHHAATALQADEAVAGSGNAITAGSRKQLASAFAVLPVQTQPEDPGLDTKQHSLQEETLETLRDTWPVVLSFFCSVTVMYLVFPFFTYIRSTGLLGDSLPQVLFFARIFADILGKLMPRSKLLMVKGPPVLMCVAVAKVVVAALFFAYIKSPMRFQRDILSVAIIVFIWLAGGYMNTTANIMAPNLVPAALTARAGALMALTFQIAHFAGLLMAVGLAWVLYGDVVA